MLLLDEPTHHLDLPARRRLQAALTDFPGAVLLVTHDAALADRRREDDVAGWTQDGSGWGDVGPCTRPR